METSARTPGCCRSTIGPFHPRGDSPPLLFGVPTVSLTCCKRWA